MGKGSSPRPYSVSLKEFSDNYDMIFSKEENMITDNIREEKETVGNCGCGRSPTGKCIGWHALSEDDFRQKLAEWDANSLETKKYLTE